MPLQHFYGEKMAKYRTPNGFKAYVLYFAILSQECHF